jgi:hypothetical protein
MTELLISEITLMGEGFCVIGLERNKERFRSLRPIPRTSYAWKSFPYGRADNVAFDLSAMLVLPPHIEDRLARNDAKRGSVTEAELVKCLKQAEVATSVRELFGCDVHASPYGGASVYVDPKDGKRSICGCEAESVSFSFRFYPKQKQIRAALVLKSCESLQSLPVVDVEWHGFAADLANQANDKPNFQQRLQNFFDSFVREEIMSSPTRFARIGLSRSNRDGLCWLMLDSLFPMPKKEWLQEFGH